MHTKLCIYQHLQCYGISVCQLHVGVCLLGEGGLGRILFPYDRLVDRHFCPQSVGIVMHTSEGCEKLILVWTTGYPLCVLSPPIETTHFKHNTIFLLTQAHPFSNFPPSNMRAVKGSF